MSPPETANSGRDRLVRALVPQVSRGQLVVGLLLAMLGFAAVTQMQEVQSDTAYSGARRQDLILLLDSLESATQRAQAQISDLEQSRRSLLSSNSRQREVVEQAREQLRTLGVLAGTLPAVGPGVRIVIQDPGGAVGASTLVNALQELRDAGAEALELDDSVRVVAETALVDSAAGIVAEGVRLRPPYVVEAIGSAQTLSSAVIFPGGLEDEVEALGGSMSVDELSSVDISSLHAAQTPQYASPTTSD